MGCSKNISEKSVCLLIKRLRSLRTFPLDLIRPETLVRDWKNGRIPGELIDLIIFKIINQVLFSTFTVSVWGLTPPGVSITFSNGKYNLLVHLIDSQGSVVIGDQFSQGELILWKNFNLTSSRSRSLRFGPYSEAGFSGVTYATIDFVNSSTNINVHDIPPTEIEYYIFSGFVSSNLSLTRDAEAFAFK